MLRQIIHIDQGKCSGCGLCAAACHEGAIAMVDGKARLLREDYCDGLGDCLPACPAGAITFETREAPAYDAAAVAAARVQPSSPCPAPGSGAPVRDATAAAAARIKAASAGLTPDPTASGCPGSRVQMMDSHPTDLPAGTVPSQLRQWPVQLKLAPVTAPFFQGADLLVAADCTAYAYGGFHGEFIRGRVVLIGCPKLDEGDQSEKLTAILSRNEVKSVTVVRMEVPCCGGLERAARTAVERAAKAAAARADKEIPLTVRVISTDGRILK